ncbi:TPA: helix-turn-helix domain-containing protein [Proteus mirabilis]
MNINKILGREIKFLRKRSLLSGCELAKAFGISQQHLSRIERGEVQWSVSFLLKVCVFFDVPMTHFIKLIEKEISPFPIVDNKLHQFEFIEINNRRRIGHRK